MTRIILIALLGVSLSFSTSVLARGGGSHGGHGKQGGHGGHQSHNQGRHYNKHHHGHYDRHAGRQHGYPAHVGYYPPPPGYYPPPIGISLSYANHGTAIHYSSYPHGGFSIGYAHR